MASHKGKGEQPAAAHSMDGLGRDLAGVWAWLKLGMSAFTGEPRAAAAGGGAGSRMMASSSKSGTVASVSHHSDKLT